MKRLKSPLQHAIDTNKPLHIDGIGEATPAQIKEFLQQKKTEKSAALEIWKKLCEEKLNA